MTAMAIPPRFTPNDRFQRFRMQEEVEKRGKDTDKEL
jgi:rRNA maturation protein Nop10